jgi:peptidyl-prolyl cis-trans isomerase SurA
MHTTIVISPFLKIKSKMLNIKKVFLLFVLFPSVLFAQQAIVADRIIAVVGGSIIMQSDIESQYIQNVSQRVRDKGNMKCQIFEELLAQKLFLNQAKVDSVEVGDNQVEQQLDSRIKYFIDQIGSQEKLEAYFGKSIYDIKEDLRSIIKEQLITQKMQSQIAGDIKITPTEVKDFYNSLSPDSIPLVNPNIEIAQIVRFPAYTESSIYDVKQKLLSLRKRILDGEKFSTLAILYSEDPGSAKLGGEIGFMSKGELDPEYAKAAFSLKDNGVSTIVESQFGYHIIQLIARVDDKVNTRHILLKPKATSTEINTAVTVLDSLYNKLIIDSIKFNDAAYYYSEDKNSKLNNGLHINKQTGSSKFEMDELNPADYYNVRNLKVGEISKPYESVDENGKQVFKIIKLLSKSTPHKANINDDYQQIQEMAIEEKRQKVIAAWIKEKQSTTFLNIKDDTYNCNLAAKGWKNK